MQASESPILELYLMYDQWKEEHDALHARLLDLCKYMRWNPTNYELDDWDQHHRKVKALFEPFMRDWQMHLAREIKTIYPFARSATGAGRMGPVSVLEQDGRIAEQFYREYRKAVDDGKPPEDALYRLLQVLMIVAEHFRVEDEIVVPLTEKWMDEIAYSGS